MCVVLTTFSVAWRGQNVDSASAHSGNKGRIHDSHDHIQRAANAVDERGSPQFGIAQQPFVFSQHIARLTESFHPQPFLSRHSRLHETQRYLCGAALPLRTRPFEIEQLVEPRQRQSVHGKNRYQRPDSVTCLSRRSRVLYRPSALQ
jgi:hypothetical protein